MDPVESPSPPLPATPAEFAADLGLLLADAVWAVKKDDDPALADRLAAGLVRWDGDLTVARAAAQAMTTADFRHRHLLRLRRSLRAAAIRAWSADPDPRERVDAPWRHAERARAREDLVDACELYEAAARALLAVPPGGRDRRLDDLVRLLNQYAEALDQQPLLPDGRSVVQCEQWVFTQQLRLYRELAEVDPDRYQVLVAVTHLRLSQAKSADPAAAVAEAEAALRCYDELDRRSPLSPASVDRREAAVFFLTQLLRRHGDETRARDWEQRWAEWLLAAAEDARGLDPQTRARIADGLWSEDLRAESIALTREAAEALSATGSDGEPAQSRLASILFRLGERLHATGERDEAAETWRRHARVERRRGRVLTAMRQLVRRAVQLGDDELALDFDAELIGELTRLSAHDEAHGPDLVAALRDRAYRLLAFGRSGEAADTAEQAVEQARALAAGRDEHRPLLAEALTDAVRYHTKAHRAAAAELWSRESLDLAEALAEADPGKHRRGLAEALHNRAVMLMDHGENAAAEDCNTRALAVYEDLLDDHPELRDRLANALCTQSVILRQLHDTEAALSCARRAVTGYTELAESDPRRYVPKLCFALSKVAGILSARGDHAEARSTAVAAVAASERLPSGDRRDTARLDALHAMVSTHVDSGHAQEVVAHSAELVSLWERRAEHDPVAGEGELAVALGNHALCLKLVGRARESLRCAQRGLAVYRRLADAEPDRFRSRLAEELDGVALVLKTLRRYDEALPLSTEALAIGEELLAANREGHLPWWFDIVVNHASILDKAGREEDALSVGRRSIDIAEELVAIDRASYLGKLVISLLNQSCRLNDMKRNEDAESVARRGVELAEELYRRDADAHRGDLAKVLHNYANALGQQDRFEEALPPLLRAAELGEAELEHHRYRGLLLLDLTLVFLAGLHVRLEQRVPARDRTRQAIRVRRELAELDPSLRLPDLADALRTLSLDWVESKDWDLTAELAAEGWDVCERLAASEPAEYWPRAATMAERLTRACAERGERDAAIAAANRALAARRAAVAAGAADAPRLLAAAEVWLAKSWLLLDDLDLARRQHADGVWRYRVLIADGRDELRANLAVAIRDYGASLGDNGFRAEALSPLVEALSRARRLAAEDREANLGRLGQALWNHAWFLRETGAKREAVTAAAEALSVIEENAATTGRDLGWELASAHDLLAVCLEDIGEADESVEHSATALEHWESMGAEDYPVELAWTLWQRARILAGRDGPAEDQLSLSRRAVELLTAWTADYPDERPELAGALVDHLRHLDRAEAPEDGTGDRALRLWRELAAEKPRRYRPGLADCLHHHAKHLLRLGDAAAAREQLEAAVAIYTRLPDGDRQAHVDGLVQARATLARIDRTAGLDLLPTGKEDGSQGHR